MKRELCFTTKQLRSRPNRRPRRHISDPKFQLPVADSSNLVVTEELSCDSSIASVNNNFKPPAPGNLRNRVTRTYCKNGKFDQLFELSENSCVESCPGENNRELLNLKSSLIVKESELAHAESSEVSKSEVSEANFGNGVVSIRNGAENFGMTCSEKFSDGQIEDEDSSSDLESSQCTPSFWCGGSGSGSEFSEKSIGDERNSATFKLFSLFKQKFCRSSFASTVCAVDDDNYDYPLLGLEDEEDEESYRMIRKRERRQVYLHDYAEVYCANTDYGELVIRQRLQMVHWIVEQATKKKLQMETMFLGVSLLDRVLSIGYFKNKDDLQIAGIACLTLATRIEEKQPYNCVRTETFCVGNATYYRCEVVGMEWLVMEVLNFKCFLPTLYNFLWYYLKAARANKKVEKTAKYLGVLALMGHQQLCFRPSTVAAALVILASIATSEDASCHLITAIHAKEKDESLPECIKSLEWLVKYL